MHRAGDDSLSRRFARRAGFGILAYHLYHRPKSFVREWFSQGGPLQRRLTEVGRREMARAALQLPILSSSQAQPFEVHVLTGRRFWYQTTFCLWSLSRHAGRRLTPTIHDDGTLREEDLLALRRLFPDLRHVAIAETISRLDRCLPSSRFPVLRDRWQKYPNIRKLIDVHLASDGWKLVLDSDMLFFHEPAFVVDWLDRPTRPLHAVDVKTSYGYSRSLLDDLAGVAVADLVNVGLCGLNSSELDWVTLERWCATLHAREGTSYFLEQALVAMLVAGRDCAVAPVSDYVTFPSPSEAVQCNAVLHHYVADSKRWYFQHSWRRALSVPLRAR